MIADVPWKGDAYLWSLFQKEIHSDRGILAMGLRNLFRFRKAAAKPRTFLDYGYVETAFDNAIQCINDRDGVDFTRGLLAGFVLVQNAVLSTTEKPLGYADTLLAFANATIDDAESRLWAIDRLASGLQLIPGHGVRFLVGQLVLMYGQAGKYPPGSLFENMTRNIALTSKAAAILEVSSKYSNSIS
jgi:hypothetical protein